jgi:DNA repair protein RadC
VLFHNHPSGDPAPSVDDVQLTRRLVEAGELMGIAVLDHIVLGDACWHSLRESTPGLFRR